MVALVFGMNVFGGAVDVVGMYTLALLINVAGLLWACGIAIRKAEMTWISSPASMLRGLRKAEAAG